MRVSSRENKGWVDIDIEIESEIRGRVIYCGEGKAFEGPLKS